MSTHEDETNLLALLFDDSTPVTIGPNQSVKLRELGTNATLRSLTIQNLGPNPLVIILEAGQTNDHRYTPEFKKRIGCHKACDAVMFFQYSQIDYIVFVELKSSNPKGYQEQFQSSKLFIDYAFSILKELQNHSAVKRKRRNVVFNTAKSAFETLNKTRIGASARADLGFTFIRVLDGETISPNRFC
jgi:hypothetical protein